jgi:uncharacterized membrane protein YkvA (DUF1232 family)
VDDFPRQKLCEIIAQYGPAICEDRRRLEALLNDLCGEYRREINLLISALKERVPEDLQHVPDGMPLPVLIAQLTQRLQDTLGLTQESAQWAVTTWGVCLGVAVPNQPGITRRAAQTISTAALTTEIRVRAGKFVRLYIEQIRLAWALMFDGRVPIIKKMIPVIGIAYILSPLSLIIDLIPVAGWLTNLAVFLLALALFNTSAPAEVVKEHTLRIRGIHGDQKSNSGDRTPTDLPANDSAPNPPDNQPH